MLQYMTIAELTAQVRVDSITVTRKGKVRRAKLYYLRDRFGKAAKVKERV